MKVLLEIDEDEYIQQVMCDTQIGKLLRRGRPINDRVTVTNGDIIKVMFPNVEVEGISGDGAIQSVAVSIGLGTSYFALDWWNAPYKEGK